MDLSNLGLGTDNPFLGTGNPYLQQAIDAAGGDMTRNFNLIKRPANNAAMLRSGSFDNSALSELNANDERNLQGSLGEMATRARMQDYGQQQDMFRFQRGFDRDVFNDSYAQNMGNLQAGVGLLGTMAGYNAQDVAGTTTQQDQPLTYWQQFANQASGIGSGFGTTTNRQGTTSNPLMSALGGAQLGSSWWNNRQSQPAQLNNTGDNSWTSGQAYGGYDYNGAAGGDYGQFF